MSAPTPSYPPPPAGPPTNGKATASLVIGIVVVVAAFLPLINVIGMVAAVVGVVLGILGQRTARRTGEGSFKASVGIALSSIALVLSAVITFVVWRYLGDLLDFVEPPDPSAEVGEEFETDGGDLVVTVTSLECGKETDRCTFTFEARNEGRRSITLDDITVKSVVDGEWDSASVTDAARSGYSVDLAPGESKSLAGWVHVYSGDHLDGIVFDANDASSHSAVVVDAGDVSSGQ
ncbi:MAG TPA: hypothetical protein VM575_04340 [Nocardioides sp.]|nr:hypothetical protein [Nocardioides sp.]